MTALGGVTPAASFWRMPPLQPRASPHIHDLVCGLGITLSGMTPDPPGGALCPAPARRVVGPLAGRGAYAMRALPAVGRGGEDQVMFGKNREAPVKALAISLGRSVFPSCAFAHDSKS